MKQNINKEQWDELNKKQKIRLAHLTPYIDIGTVMEWDKLTENEDEAFIDMRCGVGVKINIGQMIEFLGDDFTIQKHTIGYSKWFIEGLNMKEKRGSELCNLLWEAVKEKLNNQKGGDSETEKN